IFHNPRLFQEPKSAGLLTSHLDILPTMLGLAGIDPGKVAEQLKASHSEVHPLVGRDLAPLLMEGKNPERNGEALYFMTDDEVTKGLDQNNFYGWHYNSVIQPNHVETIITFLPSDQGPRLWKYSRYFDNPQFWSNPGKEDQVMPEFGTRFKVWAGIKAGVCSVVKKTQPVPEEYELYNLTEDPLEEINLATPQYATPESYEIQMKLARLLAEQCRQKRLTPTSGSVPGTPSC
ncbi:MAG TPA: arylsulfatase, partial [Bacillota bacterium]|nr:arylsulfatase [Bacillota bacterium]